MTARYSPLRSPRPLDALWRTWGIFREWTGLNLVLRLFWRGLEGATPPLARPARRGLL